MKSLERHLIEARPVWKPMHLQKLFSEAPYFSHQLDNDVSQELFHSGICLPSGSNMSEVEQDRVIDHLRNVINTLEDHRASA